MGNGRGGAEDEAEVLAANVDDGGGVERTGSGRSISIDDETGSGGRRRCCCDGAGAAE